MTMTYMYTTGARVESRSDNVFVDDLNAERTLETTYYVTDSKQVS